MQGRVHKHAKMSLLDESMEWLSNAPHGTPRAVSVRTDGTGSYTVKRLENAFTVFEKKVTSIGKLYSGEVEDASKA